MRTPRVPAGRVIDVVEPVAESIPFNRPSVEGSELDHVRAAIEGGHTSAKGPFSALVSESLRAELGAADVLLTTSCTAALELAAMLLDIRPGDTVIVPSFTFVTTALAFAREGAQLVFADIEPNTLGLDPSHVAELLDDSVRAVVAVHYAGVGCELDTLQSVLRARPSVDLIEDNAHGLLGRYRGAPLGSFGRFATLSFHETKNFVCGEGGALIVNRGDDVERAHVVYDKGTNRRAFLRHEVDCYRWVDRGSSFGLSDLLAAYLLGQLEARESILGTRRRVYERYRLRLADHAGELDYRILEVPPDREQAFHMFYVLLPTREARDEVLARLLERGIWGTFHYVPLHSSSGARPYLARRTECPVAEDTADRLLRLPFFNSLSDTQVDRISDAFLEAVRSL